MRWEFVKLLLIILFFLSCMLLFWMKLWCSVFLMWILSSDGGIVGILWKCSWVICWSLFIKCKLLLLFMMVGMIIRLLGCVMCISWLYNVFYVDFWCSKCVILIECSLLGLCLNFLKLGIEIFIVSIGVLVSLGCWVRLLCSIVGWKLW